MPKVTVRRYYVNCRERKCSNFWWATEEFFLSLHYNGVNTHFFLNGVKIYKFEAKDFEIKVSAELSNGNMKKTRL